MILGIESSCDESALAVFDPGRGIVRGLVHSQLDLHREYGGVVPELATREHLVRFPLLLGELGRDIAWKDLSAVAVTAGPGLAGCLAIGLSIGKALALDLGLPLCGVNHLRGHAFSPFLPLHAADPAGFGPALADELPHLGLLVSGGNTLLFVIGEDLSLTILAETVDDAAGEALDKGAKLQGFPYPGGPRLEEAAEGGNPRAHDFPRAFPEEARLAFSFSGLKTSLRYRLEKMDDASLAANLRDLCASYQAAVVDQLLRKTRQVLKSGDYRGVGLSGGVANNRSFRAGFTAMAREAGVAARIAEPRHTGDNAEMIAFAAFVDPNGVRPDPGLDLGFDPNWPLA